MLNTRRRTLLFAVLTTILLSSSQFACADDGLVGHWKLDGKAGDANVKGNPQPTAGPHGEPNAALRFDGRDDVIEIPTAKSPKLGAGDFSVAAWVHTEESLDDVLGDICSQFDPKTRTGFHLGIMNYAGVTTAQPNFRNAAFGINQDRGAKEWLDCGRPGDAILVFALAVHGGNLYASIGDPVATSSGRVFRYDGEQKWIDCGAPDPSNSISALAEFKGELYAGAAKYRFRGSALSESENPNSGGHVYRYAGDDKWIDCGALEGAEAISSLVVFRDKLYATSLYSPGLFRYDGDQRWTFCGNPNGKRVEATCVYNGALWATGYDEGAIYRYDGETWTHCGRLADNTQTYSFAVHYGELYVGTWPSGRVYKYAADNNWIDAGRLGEELEVMPMMVYNGSLYAGTLPLAEVYRFDELGKWSSTGRLDFTPDVKYRRAFSMAVHDGKLYSGTLPSGKVFSYEAGKSAITSRPLEPGWRHLTAVRAGDRLKLFIDGELAAQSTAMRSEDYNLNTDQPFRIGFGPHDYFNGALSDIRIYNRALDEKTIKTLSAR